MFEELKRKKENLKKSETNEKTVLNIVGNNFPQIPKKRTCVLILSGYYRPYQEFLHKSVDKILFTSKSTIEQIDKKALSFYKEYEGFDNYDTNPLVLYRAKLLHKTYNFTSIIALHEEDLIRASHLRELLGIEHGQRVKESLRFRDKVEMKKRLAESKIRIPKFKKIEEMTDVIQFLEENGYPIVVKHTKGCGSVLTFIIKNENNLLQFFEKISNLEKGLTIELEVEEYIEGEMYHVDGFYYNGEIKLIWPTKYIGLCVDFETLKFLGGINLDPSNPLTNRLKEYVIEVIKSLQGGFCFPFHAEVWVSKGELILCEIASRVAGPPIGKSIEMLWGYDIYKIFTEYQADCDFHNSYILKNYKEREDPEDLVGHCAIYPRKNCKLVRYPSGETPNFVIYYAKLFEEGTIIKKITDSANFVSLFLVIGKNEEALKERIQKTIEWFEENTTWEEIKEN